MCCLRGGNDARMENVEQVRSPADVSEEDGVIDAELDVAHDRHAEYVVADTDHT